jgi:hypothetical protein
MSSAIPQHCDSLLQKFPNNRGVISSESAEISVRIPCFKLSTALGLVVHSFYLRCGRRNNHIGTNRVTARATKYYHYISRTTVSDTLSERAVAPLVESYGAGIGFPTILI